MIAAIDHLWDLDLYLEDDEYRRLKTETIEGVLIKLRHHKRSGRISISVNDARKRERGAFGVGIDPSRYSGVVDNFSVEVFTGSEIYSQIPRDKYFGTRHCVRDGSKINIYLRSKLTDYLDRILLENLEFYRDNRELFSDDFL